MYKDVYKRQIPGNELLLEVDFLVGKKQNKQILEKVINTPVSYTHLDVYKRQLIDAIMKAKPAAVKGQYLKSVTLTSTMGPGVKINPAKLV